LVAEDGFGGGVKLCVIGVTMEPESMVTEDLTTRKHVQNEEWTKHRTLGDTVDERSSG
jgi:hypothetical protein